MKEEAVVRVRLVGVVDEGEVLDDPLPVGARIRGLLAPPEGPKRFVDLLAHPSKRSASFFAATRAIVPSVGDGGPSCQASGETLAKSGG